ncbi:MAG: hypothetical protein QM722_17370 [Piscinibacter sp.]
MARMRNTNDAGVAAPDPGSPKGGRRHAKLKGWLRRLDEATRHEHRPLVLGLLVSLLIHALLLSLRFGGDASGFPGLGMPWRDRRTDVPDLHIVLVDPPRAAPATPVPQVPAEAPKRARSDRAAPVRPAPVPPRQSHRHRRHQHQHQHHPRQHRHRQRRNCPCRLRQRCRLRRRWRRRWPRPNPHPRRRPLRSRRPWSRRWSCAPIRHRRWW